VIIGSPAGVRRLAPTELPVRIGTGPAADIRIPGPVSGEVAALVSCLDDRPFLQATGPAAGLAVNGEEVPATRWLLDGDVITAGALRIECHFDDEALRLSVAYTDTEYATLPPVSEVAEGSRIAPLRTRTAAAPVRARRWPWLAYAALVLLAAAAVYLFTARAVRVEVVPAQARVDVDGLLTPVLGGRLLLQPGEYRVSMAADGYRPRTAVIDVTDAPSQDFRFELEKLPGRLALEADPDVPLRVTIDGREAQPGDRGTYPAEAGKRALHVSAPRYRPFESTVEVEGREVLQTVPVKLVPNWADVAVRSEPAGATIRAGDETLGVTPATVPVVAGTTELEVRLEGYKPWRRRLTVEAGQQVELPLIRLQETDGLVTVVTNPPGAAVTIDGRYRGQTPLEAEIGSGRGHAVIITKPGYETVTREVEVARRGAATLRIDLEQRVGIVRIRSEPADAQLLVNGRLIGAAERELELPAIPQHIEIRKEGYAPFVTEVTPRPGLPQVVEARLLTPEQAVLAATPQTVTTKLGQVLRLVGPGQFEMGAPRREQGRRPNETQRPVRLTRPFYIGVREVTNREFRAFKPNHTSGAEKYQQLAGGEHPAVMLSWEDAASFCNWLSDQEGLPRAYETSGGRLRLVDPPTIGYRLPTEAEWEWASRYNGGGGARRYPWGERMPPAEGSGNFADQSARGIVANVLSAYDDGYPVTAPVGSFRPSPLGLYDTGGNAAEWVHDFYTVYGSGETAVATDPLGPDSGQYRVIRGSSWRHSSISELRYAYRDFGDQGRLDVGFRIARYAE
jgi:formylglycine-generating enzyme required for sulfatase activity